MGSLYTARARVGAVCLLTSLLLLLPGRPSLAQSLPPDTLIPVKRLLKQAMDASQQGKHSDSLALLEAAFRLERAPKILFLMALEHGQLGHAMVAADLAQRVLATPDQPRDKISNAETLCKRVMEQPRGEVTVRGVPGALVLVDAAIRGVVPLAAPLWLSPGAHTLRLEAGSGNRGEPLTLEVHAASRLQADLTLQMPVGKVQVTGDTLRGAALWIDGRPVGPLPYQGTLPVGEHLLEVRLRGEPLLQQALWVSAEHPNELQLRAATAPRPRWRLISGPVTMAAGLLVVGFGVHALLANGACLRSDASEPCRTQVSPDGLKVTPLLLDTTLQAATLLVSGGLLVLAGTITIALPGRRGLIRDGRDSGPGKARASSLQDQRAPLSFLLSRSKG